MTTPLIISDTPQQPKKRYYFDMDGTLAVFRRVDTFEQLLEPKYFKMLAPIKNIVRAAYLLSQREDCETYILSCYLPENPTALTEKQQWCDRFLREIDKDHRIFVPCGKRKADYIPNPSENDILIDDYRLNLDAWHGVPVKAYNGINGTSGIPWEGESIHYQSSPEEIANHLLEIAEKRTLSQKLT